MSRSKLININSAFRSNLNESTTDFTCTLDLSSFNHILSTGHVDSIRLVSALIPNKIENVNSHVNSLIGSINAVPVVYTIPVGQYTITTLITELQTALTGVTVTQSAVNNKLTFTTNASTTLVITYATSTISEIIGLTENISIGPSSTYTCLRIPNLNGIDCFLIHSKELAPNNCLSNNFTSNYNNVLAVLPVTTAVPYLSNYVFNDNSSADNSRVVHLNGISNLQSFQIKVTDGLNRSLNLPDDIQLVFRIYH